MAWIFIVLFIVGLMALMLIGVWLNSRRINLAALGIGVDFAQAVAMFITFSFLWPPELKTVFTSISLFSFNIQIIAPEVRLAFSRPVSCLLFHTLLHAAVLNQVDVHDEICDDCSNATHCYGRHSCLWYRDQDS